MRSIGSGTDIHGLLQHFALRRYRLGVRLEVALGNDQVDQFGGQVDVGIFGGAAQDRSQRAAAGHAEQGLAGGGGGQPGVVTVGFEAVFIAEGGQLDLVDVFGLVVGVGGDHRAGLVDAEAHQAAGGVAVLGNVGHRRVVAELGGAGQVQRHRHTGRAVGRVVGVGAGCAAGDQAAGTEADGLGVGQQVAVDGGVYVPGVVGGFAEIQGAGVADAQGVVERCAGGIGVGRRVGLVECGGDDVFAGVQVQLGVQLGAGAGLHAGGGDLDHTVDPQQLIAGGVFQVAVGGQGQLAVARVHGLRAVGEGEEAVTVDRQVQGVIGGGQAAGFEVLHHARDLGAQADVGAGVHIGELRGRAFEAHGLGVGNVVADYVEVGGRCRQTTERLGKSHGVSPSLGRGSEDKADVAEGDVVVDASQVQCDLVAAVGGHAGDQRVFEGGAGHGDVVGGGADGEGVGAVGGGGAVVLQAVPRQRLRAGAHAALVQGAHDGAGAVFDGDADAVCIAVQGDAKRSRHAAVDLDHIAVDQHAIAHQGGGLQGFGGADLAGDAYQSAGDVFDAADGADLRQLGDHLAVVHRVGGVLVLQLRGQQREELVLQIVRRRGGALGGGASAVHGRQH